MIIAIDGPSGAGKSTLADKIAEEIGFIHIDTGAMYRAVGVYVDDHGISTNDEAGVEAMLGNMNVDVSFKDNVQSVCVNGADVTKRIRQPEVSMLASNVSKIPAVRSFLVAQQRIIAGKNNIIMDGRDIGTVVFPDADLKIFLTATPESRAERRYREQIEKGFDVVYENVLSDVIKRDEQDTNRAVAPLKPAEDAFIVDTTEISFDESLELLISLIKEKLSI